MERSQLPLLRKKKGPKDTAAKEKREYSAKDKSSCEGKVSPFKISSSSATAGVKNHVRESSPNDDKTPKRELRPANDVDFENVVAKDGPRKATTPVDLVWSKYMVKGGSPSDNYQKFTPEKSPGAGKNHQKCASAGLIPHRSYLPHQIGLSTKFTSADGYSPSAVQKELRIYGGSPGLSTAPSVFTFDPKHLYDPDSSPIYHELDPIEGNNLPANHTYQSITEIMEEVERLHTGNGSSAGQSQYLFSGTSKSPVRSNSGPVLLCSSGTNQNGCSSPRRRAPQSNAATLPLSKPSAPPKSPGPSSSPAQSPTVAPPPITSTTSRAQSIFSKLWLQKKGALAKVANNIPVSTGVAGPKSPRNRALDAISVDVPKPPKKTNKTYSTLYAVTSPPPITASVFANYYQNFDPGQNDDDDPGVRRPALDHFDYYGLPSERNLRGFSGPSKRSFSDSTSSAQTPASKGKTSNQSGVENRLPWRTYRDLSPGRSCVDRWDVVRFGEPLESHISGGGAVSLETFKGSCSSKSPLKQNKVVTSSPARNQTAKGPASQTIMTSPLRKEFSPVKSKANRISGRTIRPNEEAKDAERILGKAKPKGYLYKTQLSKSQENVLSNFSFEFLHRQSPPGSFESLLSEDDVFLPGSSERLNLLSPPSRTTFSSPSCGIRMAELRAGRRRSDSKSPSPEPTGSSTPPPFLPLFQIPPPSRVETVLKQDVGVQTSPTKSPARIGGLSPHRYMHTIVEEDHPDQVSTSTDGKATIIAEQSNRVAPKGKSTLSEREIDTSIRSSGAPDAGERCQAGNLLCAISDDDDGDDDDDNGSSGEIKLSHTSSQSVGNDRLGAEDDALPPSPSLLPPKTTTTAPASAGGPLKTSPPLDHRRGPPEGEWGPRSVAASSPRSKTSRLRPPKPAKFFARTANSSVDEASMTARYSPVRARAGEQQTPLKQSNDLLPSSSSSPSTTKTLSPSIKHPASAKSVETSAGTGDHATGQPPVSEEPQGPLKGCRNGVAAQQQGGSRTEQKKSISQLKSLFDPTGAPSAESQDRIDATGGTRPGRTGAQRRQLSAEHSDSSPVSCSRNTAGNSPSKFTDSNATTTAAKHSSLSSSLTSSSSSSSVFSVPDSESEGTTLTRPSRKDTSACIGRPGSNGKLSDGSVTVKTIASDGNLQERSRLALPKISVSRSKDKSVTGTTQSQHEGSVKQDSPFTNDNPCDDDDDDDDDETMKLSSSEPPST